MASKADVISSPLTDGDIGAERLQIGQKIQ
jgi:hypothetical protein